jgi:four helix bundle protein
MDLAVAVYSLNRSLRELRHSDLASQLMRAVVSVPANIAEGRGRASPNEFARFLSIALGSLREVETLLVLLERLGVVKKATVAELLKQADETGRVLYGLERATRGKNPPRRPKPPSDV